MNSLEQELEDFREKSRDIRSFLEGVVEFSDKIRRDRYPDCELCRKDEFENAELSFISASRLVMQSFLEAGMCIDNALAQYVVGVSRRALDSPFPLRGDFLRMHYVASLFLNHEIDGIVYTTIAAYVRYDGNRAISGESLRLNIRQNGALELRGGSAELRTLLHEAIAQGDDPTLPPKERIAQAIKYLPQDRGSWRGVKPDPSYAAIEVGDVYKDIGALVIESFDERAGDYEAEYVNKQIHLMACEERERFYELLHTDKNRRFGRSYYDDVYRVLWYLSEQKSGIMEA